MSVRARVVQLVEAREVATRAERPAGAGQHDATHGGLTRLVKLLGLARAKEVLLGGEDLDAQAAHAAGLLSELADGDPVDVARARVEKMLMRAPLSFAAAKRLLQLAADADQRSAILAESLAQTNLLQSDDHREGLAAARERRAPEFRGA